jgi:hypothetical protein
MEPSEIILAAETQFAREVALGVIYQLPLPIWYSLIPGMFLFDFIRRNRTIGNVTKFYIFPRRLALNAATSLMDGIEKLLISEQIEQEIGQWLNSQNLSCQGLPNAYKEFVDVLVEHYKKCLNTKKANYNDMIQNVYKTRETFETHINKLEKLETKIDQILMGHTNLDKKFKQRLDIEAKQVKLRRNRMVDDIF